MRHALAVLAACVALALILVAYALGGSPGASPPERQGLTVVVTFPSLAEDVKMLVCPGDSVVVLVPAGVDPHSYQLRPSDVDALKRADLIVSTGHAPFEVRIRELCQHGELRARLVEITRIPGIELRRNPATGVPNMHMPIYDPSNYIKFVRYLAKTMASLRPSCARQYELAASKIVGKVLNLTSRTPRLNLAAAADSPLVQYAVEWMGIKVEYLLEPEHGVPVTPQILTSVEKAMLYKEIDVVVVVTPSQSPASRALLSMASRYGLPVLEVPSPISEGSMLGKIERVVENALKLLGQG